MSSRGVDAFDAVVVVDASRCVAQLVAVVVECHRRELVTRILLQLVLRRAVETGLKKIRETDD